MDLIGNQMVQGPNESFSAASKGFKGHQMMNKGLRTLSILINEFEQESHECFEPH